MTNAVDFSSFKIVRLNCELFPVSTFEREAYTEYGMQPIEIEASGNKIVEQARDCDAIVVVSEALPRTVIDQLVNCKIISRLGAGTDKIDHQAALDNGIRITNVPDFCYEEQADHAIAMLLSLIRQLPQMDQAMRNGKWDSGRQSSRSIRRLQGRTLGLIGFGGSAVAFARRAVGFGLNVMACRNRQVADPVADELNVTITDFETVVRTADYLSLHLPLNEQTQGMFDASVFAQMKQGCLFINTARGAIVDEKVLAARLASGHLGGAGIDVFHDIQVHGPDGVPPEHPLLNLPNVIVSPHTAAFSIDSSKDVGTGGVENVALVLSGQSPPSERIVC